MAACVRRLISNFILHYLLTHRFTFRLNQSNVTESFSFVSRNIALEEKHRFDSLELLSALESICSSFLIPNCVLTK